MTPMEIKIEMLKKGISQRKLAQKIGITQSAIYLTVYGFNKGKRTRKAIANAIDKSITEIWPSESKAA